MRDTSNKRRKEITSIKISLRITLEDFRKKIRIERKNKDISIVLYIYSGPFVLRIKLI